MGFFQDLLGDTSADAARKAAADTYAKQQAATGGIKRYGDTLPGAYNQLATQFQPYAQAGGSALQQLMGGLGLNGAEGSQQFTDAYHALPGYQSGLDTGIQAAQRGANASNMFNSGKTLKNLYRFGSNYEDQRSGDYLSRLAGLSGMGQTATAQGVGTQAQGLAGQLGTRQSAYQGELGSAGTIGQGNIAAANAQAAGSQNLLNAGTNLLGKFLGFGF